MFSMYFFLVPSILSATYVPFSGSGVEGGKVTKISNSFELFRFQERMAPANVVFGSSVAANTVDELSKTLTGHAHVGVIDDSSLSRIFGIAVAQISRPFDGFKVAIETVSEIELLELSQPLMLPVRSQDQFGVDLKPHTVTAVVDERDPLQLHEVSQIFRNLSTIYGNLSFQFCDFYKCPDVVSRLGIVNHGKPVFVLSSARGDTVERWPLVHPEPGLDEFKEWLNHRILGIKPDREMSPSGIPILYAREFHQVVLDPSRDVIVLVWSPDMRNLEVAQANVRKLMEAFMPFPTIAFYELNVQTQMTPGLNIKSGDEPVLVIWPAQQTPSGRSLPATFPLRKIFENIMVLMKTKIAPDRLQGLNAKMSRSV